jgi:hypothetical protein
MMRAGFPNSTELATIPQYPKLKVSDARQLDVGLQPSVSAMWALSPSSLEILGNPHIFDSSPTCSYD